VSLRTGPSPPLEWISILPLVAAVLVTFKGAESPGSGRIGVTGALVFFSDGNPWDEGAGGLHKGHFHIPAGMVVSGEGSPYAKRRYICHREIIFTCQRDSDTPRRGLAGEEGRVRARERLKFGVLKGEIEVIR